MDIPEAAPDAPCPGYRIGRLPGLCSPAKRSASREAEAKYQSRHISRRRRLTRLSGLPTGRQR
ncbi:hypothetical protein [Klebsiella grimontii]|uniref:hypothetical protein n=1 Tax=Klebsiella grimontii TaxID=2058152 RepID=UPI0006BD185D|nr:hypothetical protein [Klebsiella grimontii]QLT85861.1 hypothetical protein HV252_00145 [Klebsiella grimontii]QQQ24651.1 hypothetical protein JIZ39_10290 [Klebsiella grimontii]BAS43549.1 maltose ABC transporter, permease protein [Klebsiella oxytoca]